MNFFYCSGPRRHALPSGSKKSVPDYLAHLHFDDWMRYAINAVGAGRGTYGLAKRLVIVVTFHILLGIAIWAAIA